MNLSPGVIKTIENVSLFAGVGYAVLAARRNRLCWIVGAVSSACAAVAYGASRVPMQSGLQVFFVGLAFYGWISWTRSAAKGELPVGLWPLPWHIGAALALILLSLGSASLLSSITDAADWPLLDSLIAWFSLFATWLAARGKLENWLYWIVIDVLLVFLSYEQGLKSMALLSLLLVAIAAGGFIAWRRRLHAQLVPA